MSFLQHCQFTPALRGYIGVEREFFLVDAYGRPIPKSVNFLTAATHIANIGDWGYELSACQVEHRTPPIASRDVLRADLEHSLRRAELLAESLDMHLRVQEVAPEDMTLEVYPDPRYLNIRERLPPPVLSAACRVTGTHVHLGVSDMDEAIAVHNRLTEALPHLARLGDHSHGERLRLYRVVAPDCDPPLFRDIDHLEEVAVRKGFAENPRDCWHLVRISRHGTVEVRVFGMTADAFETCEYAATCYEIAFGHSLPA